MTRSILTSPLTLATIVSLIQVFASGAQETSGNRAMIKEIENDRCYKAVSFLPKSHDICLGGGAFRPGEVAILGVPDMKGIAVNTELKLSAWSVSVSPDGLSIASGGGDGEIRIYDRRLKRVKSELDAGAANIKAVAFSPDARLFASSATEHVKLWDARKFSLVGSVPQVRNLANICFTSDSRHIVIGDMDSVRFWEVEKRCDAFQAPYGFVAGLLVTPDGRYLVVSGVAGGDPSLIRIWSIADKKEVCVLKGHLPKLDGQQVSVISLAVDNSSKYLISGGGDQTVRIWDLSSGDQVASLKGNKSIVRSLALSHDNKYLVTCSDSFVRVYSFELLIKK